MASHPTSNTAEPRLSVCMIVKDEEGVLPRCLRSVQGLADEIVVVDTGSTDRTVELAQSFGANVFHYKWKDDFAAARNYAMDRATGDWIFQIDADEEFHLPDIPHLREIIRRQDADGIHIVIRNFFPSPATQTDESLPDPMSHPHSVNHFPRLVRNRPEIRYSGAIHEGFREIDHVLISDLSLFHYGYAQEDTRKSRRFERNRRMTLKNVEQNPDNAIAHYYAATTNLSAQLLDDAKHHFLEMIRLADPESPREKHFYQMANCHLATLAMLQGDYATEERYAREALKPDEGYLDPWLRLGEACFFQDKCWEAERALRRYLAILEDLAKRVRVTKYTLYLTDEAHYARFFLGRLAQLREDPAAAQEYYEHALALREGVWGPHYFLSLLYTEQNDPRAKEHLDRARELNPDLKETIEAGAETTDHRPAVTDPQSAIRNPQSAIRTRLSPIPAAGGAGPGPAESARRGLPEAHRRDAARPALIRDPQRSRLDPLPTRPARHGRAPLAQGAGARPGKCRRPPQPGRLLLRDPAARSRPDPL